MNKIKWIWFCISVGFIPIGLFFRERDWQVSNYFIVLGFLGLFIFFLAKTIKELTIKKLNIYFATLQILTVLMSICLFSRYMYHRFADYPGLVIIPIYIIGSVLYLIKGVGKDLKLTTATLLYLFLSIPLFGFGFGFHKLPRQYFPKEWYDRYNADEGIVTNLPYNFEYKETELLSKKGSEMRDSKDFLNAIPIYRKALKLEPRNPRILFDLSECFARVNNLEKAIALLDTAIIIDSTCAAFFNNRGLLYFKLKLYDKAILDYSNSVKLDSTMFVSYSNLALAYYANTDFANACKAIQDAEHHGLDMKENEKIWKELKWIKRNHCQ